jgi:COX assembly protein 1
MAKQKGEIPQYTPESISKREEEIIRTLMRQSARQECETSVRDFIECSRGRTISMAWKCREENDRMSRCLIHHTTEEELEKRKMLYWEEKMKRTPLTSFPPGLERDLEEGTITQKR